MNDKPKQMTLAELEESLNLKAPAGFAYRTKVLPDGHIRIISVKRP